MKYQVNDKFLLAGIECKVALVNGKGWAYLLPAEAGEEYNNQYTMIGLVFAKINEKGLDDLGNKAIPLANVKCGAI